MPSMYKYIIQRVLLMLPTLIGAAHDAGRDDDVGGHGVSVGGRVDAADIVRAGLGELQDGAAVLVGAGLRGHVAGVAGAAGGHAIC